MGIAPSPRVDSPKTSSSRAPGPKDSRQIGKIELEGATPQGRKTTEAMVEMWVKRGEALDAIKARALHDYNCQANQAQVEALLELAFQYRTPRYTSGLVEMRRLFEKAWS